jgi:hypothetical protein|nr:Ig-like domain-containing protein [Kofleriaceae bacterium]
MRQFAVISLSLFAATAATGCADHAFDGSGPAVDPNAPVVHITSPDRGSVLGDVQTVMVTGTATDDVGVTSLTVNGTAVPVAADGTWSMSLPVSPGTQLVHAVALDASNNQGTETRALLAGPMVPIDTAVPQAMQAALSAQTFSAIGQGAAGFMNTADLEAMIAPHNPVYSAGAPNGPDCLYAMASITALSEHGATISLTPMAGGVFLDVEMDNFNAGLHVDYAVACIDGSHDASATADHLSVTGMLTIGVGSDGTFATSLTNPDVQFTNLDLELGGIPGDIVDLLDLEDSFGGIMGWAVQQFMGPAVTSALSGMTGAHTVSVLGTNVNVSVAPNAIQFDNTGAILDLDTSLRAQNDGGGPGYVYVPNGQLAMDDSKGFQLAVADDAANQLLASLWTAKAFDQTLDLTTGPYGQIGTLYDSVQLQAAVPPFVDLSGDGLKLTVGDLMATFSLKGQPVTRVAVNAQVDVKVTADPMTGALRLDVGTPTVYVDVDDDAEGVMGANELSNSQFETIASFALSRIVAVGSGTLGAVPLPSVGGVSLANVGVQADAGYLLVTGAVQP